MSLSWEADCFTYNKEILYNDWNQKDQYCDHKSLPVIFILKQINPSTSFHSFPLKSIWYYASNYTFSRWSCFISGVHSKFPSAMQFTYLTQFIPFHLIIVLILNKECKLWCSLLCSFLLPPRSKHLFSILSGRPSDFCPPLMTDKVLCPSNMTGTTVVVLWNIL